jgi:hypothetical protein
MNQRVTITQVLHAPMDHFDIFENIDGNSPLVVTFTPDQAAVYSNSSDYKKRTFTVLSALNSPSSVAATSEDSFTKQPSGTDTAELTELHQGIKSVGDCIQLFEQGSEAWDSPLEWNTSLYSKNAKNSFDNLIKDYIYCKSNTRLNMTDLYINKGNCRKEIGSFFKCSPGSTYLDHAKSLVRRAGSEQQSK